MEALNKEKEYDVDLLKKEMENKYLEEILHQKQIIEKLQKDLELWRINSEEERNESK